MYYDNDYDFEEIADYYYDRDSAIDFITHKRLEEYFLDYIGADEEMTFDDIITHDDEYFDTALYEYIVKDDYERSMEYAYFIGWQPQEPEYEWRATHIF